MIRVRLLWPRRQHGGARGTTLVPDRLSVFEMTEALEYAFDYQRTVVCDPETRALFGCWQWVPRAPTA